MSFTADLTLTSNRLPERFQYLPQLSARLLRLLQTLGGDIAIRFVFLAEGLA
jgi:hypothetical protein